MTPAQPIFNLYNSSLKAGLGFTNTWLEGALRVRQHQMEQISAAMSGHENIARQLEEKGDASEFHAVVLELARNQVEMSLAYWSGLGQALRESHLELGKQMSSGTLQMIDGWHQSLEEAPLSMVPAPMMSTFRAAINVASMGLRQSIDRASMNGATGSHHADAKSAPAGRQKAQPSIRH